MFWWLPSWLGYLNAWDVAILTAYVLSFALFESLVILGFTLLLSLVFPGKYIQDKFVAQGSTISFMVGVSAVALQRKIGLVYKLGLRELIVYTIATIIAILLSIILFSCLNERFRKLPYLIKAFADRMTVFGYIYLPLGLLGLVVVLLRNIF